MNYWLHRISHHAEVSYPLLDKGFLTIGFSGLISDEIIDKVKLGDWDFFNGEFLRLWESLPRLRFNLWNFLSMSQGDIVIVPSWGTFHVCEIVGERPIKIGETFSDGMKTWGNIPVEKESDFLFSLGREGRKEIDLGFAWKIKVLFKNVPRDKYADSKLTSRMKIRQTNANISDLKSSIEKSIENFKNERPIHIHTTIIEETASTILKIIIRELNDSKFEKLIKTYFLKIGADEVFIPPKNERGKEGDADIIAVFESIKLIIYSQAKFQTGLINDWGVSQIRDYKNYKEEMEDGYNKIAWLVTTANSFNKDAENLAKENQIQLINGVEFSKMLLNAGIDLLNKSL